MLESLQGRLIFGRTTRIRTLQPGPHTGSYRRESHELRRPDGTELEGWSAVPMDRPTAGVLLYFGGRNENVVWAPDMASFNPGWAVYAFNYRGFGESSGRASERRAKGDARAILEFATAREWTATLAIVGRSLGTAIALDLAREAKPQRLVLMSPFESVPKVLHTRPLGRIGASLVTQRFACADLAAAHHGEALVLLAGTDDSVPHEQSRRLCERLPHRPALRTIAGTTHQSLPRSGGAQRAIAGYLPSTFMPRSA